ncbi:MAG TPA: galactose-1-epimerase [Lachnospiraceae bacterium]|nr:galactose-1-epimerase [Lachnospiraceae bacterium]
MKKDFGITKKGEAVTAYTICNEAGMSATIINFGATLVKLEVPDKVGNMRDVVLGYDDVSGYENGETFFGAVIGRNANRICGGKVTLDGVTYQMDQNDNDNNLHSGFNGIDKKIWTTLDTDNKSSVTFICKSNDLEQGLPGNVTITVTYTITDDNELLITYDAASDKKTVINLTNHSYFNLNGHYKGNIEGHELVLYADYYNPVIDEKSIPTEENASVEGTVFDFRTAKEIGRDIEADDIQLKYVGGYDHNYIINGNSGDMRPFASLYSKESGILMEFSSDQTGTQLYTGNFIGDQIGKGGFNYHKRSGMCLEPQYIPNAMNFIPEGSIDSPVFDADERYHSVSCFKFSIK